MNGKVLKMVKYLALGYTRQRRVVRSVGRSGPSRSADPRSTLLKEGSSPLPTDARDAPAVDGATPTVLQLQREWDISEKKPRHHFNRHHPVDSVSAPPEDTVGVSLGQ